MQYRRKATGDETARENCIGIFDAVCRNPTIGVQGQNGQMLGDILRTMGLPFSTGKVADKANRIIAGMPGYLVAVQAGAR